MGTTIKRAKTSTNSLNAVPSNYEKKPLPPNPIKKELVLEGLG